MDDQKTKERWFPPVKRRTKPGITTITQLGNDVNYLTLALQNTLLIEQKILEADGEITPEVEALIAGQSVNLNLPESVDLVRQTMERLSVSAAHMKAQADLFKRVQTALTNAEKMMKERVKELMVEAKISELQGNAFRFVCATRPDKIEIDEEKLPREFFKQVIELVPDREKIAAALDLGHEVPGCEMVPVHALTPYVQKIRKVAS